MKIKTTHYSNSRESVNSYGLKRWDKVGFELELDEGESVENALMEAKRKSDEFHNLNQAELTKMDFQYTPPASSYPQKQTEPIVDEEFEKVKERLNEFEYQQEAQSYLETTEYKLTYEANKIVSSKPLKQ